MFPRGQATVIDAGWEALDGKKVKIIKVVPLEDAASIILTKIWVDVDRMLALRTETTTRDNGTVKMDLYFSKYVNLALPDKVVVHLEVKDFKLPKGVTMDYDVSSAAKQVQSDPGKNRKGKIEINYLKYDTNKGLDDKIFREKT